MREFHKNVSHARVTQLLNYQPETGEFTWRESRGTSIKVGMAAGSIRDGYVCIWIDGISYKAHRLAFLHMTGQWPTEFVDHIDGDRANNRWANLREATCSGNNQNRGLGVNNRSGFLGVGWKKAEQKWQARIRVAGKLKHLGYFDDPTAAAAAYADAKARLHTFNPILRS
jgi:hypothetical protein